MELCGIGHIGLEFIQDFWIKFVIELECDLEVSNCKGIELMYLQIERFHGILELQFNALVTALMSTSILIY